MQLQDNFPDDIASPIFNGIKEAARNLSKKYAAKWGSV